jgi:hypothetical protein
MLDTGEEHHVILHILHMAKFINICIDTTPIRKAYFTFFLTKMTNFYVKYNSV